MLIQLQFTSQTKERNYIPCLSKEKNSVIEVIFSDVGVVPNISLLAFEKIPTRYYYDLLKEKNDDSYKDYQVTAEMVNSSIR